MNVENISEREGLERLENLYREESFKEASSFASELRDRFPSSFQLGFLHYKILVNLEKYSDSENILDDLLKLYPENINLLLEKGELLISRGKVAESKLFFDKVLFSDPFNVKAKEGIDRIKKKESGGSVASEKYKSKKAVLEDTMKEAELEKFLDMNDEASDDDLPVKIASQEDEGGMEFQKPSGEDQDEKVSINFEDSSLLNRDDILKIAIKESEEKKKPADKIETALDELNKFAESDIKELDLGKDKKEEPETEDVENGFITDSAALLYLKQGLYDEAKSVYSKLYEKSDESLYSEKLEKLKRIKLANLKINALEGFLEKIRSGRVRIV